jgi:hypothetical protein
MRVMANYYRCREGIRLVEIAEKLKYFSGVIERSGYSFKRLGKQHLKCSNEMLNVCKRKNTSIVF